MKTLITEILALNNFLRENKEIREEDINLANVKFQIEGNTIIHMTCLEVEHLKIVLEYLEKHKKEYLIAILMENDNGKTPLDITIENDSPKTTDLLLKTLSQLEEGSYSQQFFDKFPKLLEMKLNSFHEFLNS